MSMHVFADLSIVVFSFLFLLLVMYLPANGLRRSWKLRQRTSTACTYKHPRLLPATRKIVRISSNAPHMRTTVTVCTAVSAFGRWSRSGHISRDLFNTRFLKEVQVAYIRLFLFMQARGDSCHNIDRCGGRQIESGLEIFLSDSGKNSDIWLRSVNFPATRAMKILFDDSQTSELPWKQTDKSIVIAFALRKNAFYGLGHMPVESYYCLPISCASTAVNAVWRFWSTYFVFPKWSNFCFYYEIRNAFWRGHQISEYPGRSLKGSYIGYNCWVRCEISGPWRYHIAYWIRGPKFDCLDTKGNVQQQSLNLEVEFGPNNLWWKCHRPCGA